MLALIRFAKLVAVSFESFRRNIFTGPLKLHKHFAKASKSLKKLGHVSFQKLCKARLFRLLQVRKIYGNFVEITPGLCPLQNKNFFNNFPNNCERILIEHFHPWGYYKSKRVCQQIEHNLSASIWPIHVRLIVTPH